MAINLFDLSGKKALVTGGNSGLGLAYATGLAKAGADVAIWGRDKAKTEKAAERLRQFGTRIEPKIVDVSREAEVIDAMGAAIKQFNRLDCVIANAGIANLTPFHEMTAETYHEMLAAAQHGSFYTLREAAKHMIARAKAGDAGGSLIICGSLTIFGGAVELSHYGAAKGALNSMSKGMAVELGPYGVRVNVVAAGLTAIEKVKDMEGSKSFMEAMAKRNPNGRIAEMEDLEGIVVYLASDMSRHHTGDTITIDGGQRASLY
jgi:NAD(P)-dependent dehydrogenase (short-subunit alcohol dehydrogenase family)